MKNNENVKKSKMQQNLLKISSVQSDDVDVRVGQHNSTHTVL